MKNQLVKIFGGSLWHYTVVRKFSDDGFLCFAGAVRNPEGVINDLLAGLGPCGLAHMQHPSVLAFELDGDAILALEVSAQTLPTQMNTAGLELKANGVD